MTAEVFEARVRRDGSTAIVDLRGPIDAAADARLEEAYEEATGEAPGGVVLNFADVGYINSTGIALIVGILAKARKSGTAVRACGLSDHYREIFEITRLADFVQIFPDEPSALAGTSA